MLGHEEQRPGCVLGVFTLVFQCAHDQDALWSIHTECTLSLILIEYAFKQTFAEGVSETIPSSDLVWGLIRISYTTLECDA